jgi:hypothetical protein
MIEILGLFLRVEVAEISEQLVEAVPMRSMLGVRYPIMPRL